MQTFTGWEYLLIDLANTAGLKLDKKPFEVRLEWARKQTLESFMAIANGSHWKKRPMFIKAILAYEDAINKRPMGHFVGLDALCSGVQMMAVMTGCEASARTTGLIPLEPDEDLPDAYMEVSEEMGRILGRSTLDIRAEIKDAVMTALYGSKKVPVKYFGEGTAELFAFYEALNNVLPGPSALLPLLIDTWIPNSPHHHFMLPDGYVAHIKNMVKFKTKIEVDEYDHRSFNYIYKQAAGEPFSVSNAANGVHAVDAYVMRSMVRRCSYDPVAFNEAALLMESSLLARQLYPIKEDLSFRERLFEEYPLLKTLIREFRLTGIADLRIIDILNSDTVTTLDTKHMQMLMERVNDCLLHKPFPISTVHDDFRAHPNNLNWVRYHYKEIMADIADSNLVYRLLEQLQDRPIHNKKPIVLGLGDKIRNSEYGIA